MQRSRIPNSWGGLVCLLLLLVGHSQAAVECDGVDDGLTTNTALSSFVGASAATYTLWFQASGTIGTGGCAEPDSQKLMGDRELWFNVLRATTDAWCGWSYGSSGYEALGTAAANTPHHAALLNNGTNIYFYVDGAYASQQDAGPIGDLTNPLDLCTATPYSLAGEGIVSAAQTYAAVLTEEEIAVQAQSHLMRVGTRATTGSWTFDTCPTGADADGVSFFDHSGLNHPFVASDGANNTGATCAPSTVLRAPWGIW